MALLLGGICAGAEEGPPAAGAPADPKARAAALVAGMKAESPEERAQAAQAAASLQHPLLMTPLLRLLTDEELGVRLPAMKALASRQDPGECRRAATALAPRMARLGKHPADREELFAVFEALDRLAQPVTIKPLLDGIDLETAPEEVHARLLAVAKVPVAEAIERLIQFLDRGRRGPAAAQKDAARKALMLATGQRMNRDPDAWRAWWRENKQDFDFAAVAAARTAADAERAEKERRRAERKAERPRGKPDGKPEGDGDGEG